MQLAIDIGNSNVVLGIHKDKEWLHIWRLPTLLTENPLFFYQDKIADQLFEFGIRPHQFKQIILSTVVPQLRESFIQLSKQYFNQDLQVLGPDLYTGLSLKTDHPEEMGSDLYANAMAAHHLYQKDCIIIDFGTALTFTVVNKEGQVLGVNIAPGLKTAIHALFLKTAQLPEVPLNFPDSAIGKNTTHAIQSGILVGYVGLVRHMVAAIRAELGDSFITVATGGLVNILSPLKEDFQHITPNLTLEGLRIIGKQL